jgi:hypothetical protein
MLLYQKLPIDISLSFLLQYPIKAGEEFTVSTDTKYMGISDNQVMFVDYVSEVFSERHYRCSNYIGQSFKSHSAWQTDLR